MMLLLSPEREEEFARMYDHLRAQAFPGGVVSDAAELAFVGQLIRDADTAGMVPHNGRLHRVNPAATDYLAPATVAALTPLQRVPPVLLALIGALVVALVVYAVGMALGGGRPSTGPTPSPTGVARAAPPTPPGTVIPAASPNAAAVARAPTLPPAEPTLPASFPSVGGERLLPSRPTTLTLGDRSFVVVPAPVVSNTWVAAPNAGQASWLDGSTINWTFALLLDGDPAARTWGAGLRVPLTVTLRTADGRARAFVLTKSQTISRAETEYLRRTWAGMTILLRLDAGATRRLLRGAEALPAGADPGTPVTGEDLPAPAP